MKARVNALVAILVSLLCVIAAEFYCRRFLPEITDTPMIRIASQHREVPFDILDFNNKYHHSLILSENIAEPDPEALRVIFLGDSFTYGLSGADFSFPRLVQEYFQRGSLSGIVRRKMQCFNLGCISHSPSIYGVVLREFAPRLKPHLVVIAVDDSDPQDDYFYRKMLVRDAEGLPISVYPGLVNVPKPLRPLARRLKIMRLTFVALSKIKIFSNESDDAYFMALRNRYGHYRDGDKKAWGPKMDYSIEIIDAMVRYCRRNNIDVALVNYPYSPAVTTDFNFRWRSFFGLEGERVYEPVFHSMQKEYARKQSIPYYDFTPYLRAQEKLDGIYDELDGHFTARGNILFAQELTRFIQSLPLRSGSN